MDSTPPEANFDIRHFLLQATNMIATGPKPPLSFNSSNDEAPIKLDIGGGMGEQRYVELSKQAVPLT